MSESPVVETLIHTWQALAPLREPMAVMGGLALAAWRHARSTQDVDLLLGASSTPVDELVVTLEKSDVLLKASATPRSIGSIRVLQFLYEPPNSLMPVQVDLLLGELEYHQAALQRRVTFELGNPRVAIEFLSCEDLVLHKLIAGRMIDLADAAALLRANKGELDLAYLLQWASNVNVRPELQRVWQEANPGEPLS